MVTIVTIDVVDSQNNCPDPVSSYMITMRHKMEGYINSGFNNSLSTFSLKTQSFLNSKDEPEHPIDTKTKVIPTTETDLDNDGFLSDLEKNSTRGFPEHDSDLPVLHGYCDRSFEKDILTFTNGDTGTVGQRTPETTDNDGVNVNGRQGKLHNDLGTSEHSVI